MRKPRPSCKTIAEAAGVSRMTVSMALRDHPRVAPQTRERIKRIAEEQGYTPDPNLTELMRYLRKRDVSKEEPVIAILNGQRKPLAELGSSSLLVREGAIERAEHLGFKTEDFWLHEPGMRLQRIVQILQARGIHGLVVLPVGGLDDVFSLPQEDFMGVATCGVAARLGFNQVHPHFYQAMHVGISNLTERGFERVGFCLTNREDIRSNHLYLSYLLWHQKNIPESNRIPPLLKDEIGRNQLIDWVEAERPDVILSPSSQHCYWLKAAGFDIPNDISFAALAPGIETDGEIAHVRVDYRKIGATAIDLLKTKLAHEQLGPTDNPAVTLIRGEWNEGSSVRKPRKTVAA